MAPTHKEAKRSLQYTHVPCEEIKEIRQEQRTQGEDITSIKIGMGYHDKRNGDFRQEVDGEQKSLNTQMREVTIQITEVQTTMSLLLKIFTLMAALMGTILVLLFTIL